MKETKSIMDIVRNAMAPYIGEGIAVDNVCKMRDAIDNALIKSGIFEGDPPPICIEQDMDNPYQLRIVVGDDEDD